MKGEDIVYVAYRSYFLSFWGDMFEITLGNWPPVARILQENVSEFYVAFSIIHKLVIGFAVIGVINGVFMQETFKVLQPPAGRVDKRVVFYSKLFISGIFIFGKGGYNNAQSEKYYFGFLVWKRHFFGNGQSSNSFFYYQYFFNTKIEKTKLDRGSV